ncbi:MAG: NAD(+) synthase [Bacteroidales bacterium]|jgi:NAD+ synthase (glutamine-hydrolysing)|nr:NAD(+) synthase [Bacteroidales bacterium]
MRIRIIQKGFHANRIKENFLSIRTEYRKALAERADILVLPKDAICGYAAETLLQREGYFNSCLATLNKLAKETSSCAILCELANHFFLLEKGEVSIIKNNAFLFKKYNCAVNTTDLPNADIAFILDALPFVQDIEMSIRKQNSNIVYVNQCGGNDNVVLYGHSFVKGFNDVSAHILPCFEECSCTFEWTKQSFTPLSKIPLCKKQSNIELIHDGLIATIRDYFKNAGIKKAIVGLSGGIDSAVVLPLAVKALGRTNVFGVMMPSQFSTDHSVKDAVKLADNLQIYYEIIPIKPIYDVFMMQLSPLFKSTKFGLAEENLQARSRGTLLMSIANKFGYLLINTSNKSEAFCGYGTMYGDLCGSIAPLGDLYKSQVYELAKYINRKQEIIPRNTIIKAPSAELRPNQKDSDSLGEYDTIEKIATLHLEDGLNAAEISKNIDVAKAEVERILSLFYRSEFKRRQAPPAIVLSSSPLREYGLPL